MKEQESPFDARAARRAPVATQAVYSLLAQAVDKLLPVAILLYLARSLSAESFGVYSFLIAYLAFFQLASDYSLDTVTVRAMVQDPPRRAEILYAGLILKILTSVASAVLAVALVRPISGGNVDLQVTAVAALTLVTSLGGVYRSYFRAVSDIRTVFLIAIARALAVATTVIVAIAVDGEVMSIFTAMAAANILVFVVVSVWVRPARIEGATYGQTMAQLLRSSSRLSLHALALTISLRAGQILLMSMRGPTEVGLLGAASRVSEAFALFPDALMIPLLPLLAGLQRAEEKRLLAVSSRATRYVVSALGLPVVLCITAGSPLMGLLYGPSFATAGPALSVLGLGALLAGTGAVILNVLIAAHKEVPLYRNSLVFAVVNVALSIPLIHLYGYDGAAIAMVVSSAGSQAVLATSPATSALVRPCLTAGARPLGAALVAVLAGLVSARWAQVSPSGQCAISAVVYVSALLASRAVTKDDVVYLWSATRQQPV